jgi:hypothetical protein
MGRRKGKAARGKSRVSQRDPALIEGEWRAIADRFVMTTWLVDGRCPLCAPTDVEQEPYGPVRATVRAAVSPVQADTV